MLSVASLFAGIGGFDLAAERMGLEVVLQAEINPSAQRVLRARFPRARLEPDATRVDLRGVDLVTAGFPCQGLSQAASTRKAGGILDPDSPSHVVLAVIEQIAKAPPEYLLFENSSELETAKYAEDMRVLLAALRAIGYSTSTVLLNAGCYGSRMRRSRTFILGRTSGFRLMADPAARVRWQCKAEAIGVQNQHGGAMWCAQPSITLKAGSYSLMVTPDEVRSLLPEAVESLFGYPTGWTSDAGSMTDRYDRLGNSVSIYAARAALQLLLRNRADLATPSASYTDLYPLTKPAGGGAAGSALGRIARTWDVRGGKGRMGNTNLVELHYCVPVYLRWFEEHLDTVRPQDRATMLGYLDTLAGRLPAPRPWPQAVEVVMEQ